MIQFVSCMIFVSTKKEQDSLFKKNAIFFSFEDFKNNKPAIDTLKLHLQENRACSHTVQYETGSADSLVRYIGNIWGFSDGNYLSVRHKGDYGRFIEIGSYCVFSNLKFIDDPNSYHGIGRNHEIETNLYYGLNYYTGGIEDLRVGKVKKYLKNDKELFY
jgi:hypothetical protein